jgi:hypothetical protein
MDDRTSARSLGTAEAPGGRAAAELPPEAASVGAARRWVAQYLAHADLDDLVPTAQLLVSELAANAVLHARTPFTVSAGRRGDRVRVSVSDTSPVLPQAKVTSLSAATGRGLSLVGALATDHGVTRTESGKEVWFELVPGAAPGRAVRVRLGARARRPARRGAAAGRVTHRSWPSGSSTSRSRSTAAPASTRTTWSGSSRSSRSTPTRWSRGVRSPRASSALVDAIGRRYAGSTSATDAVRDAAIARGADRVDLDYLVPAAVAPVCIELGAMLDLADEFCRSEHLLTLETPPLARRFRDWFLGEFVGADQRRGADTVVRTVHVADVRLGRKTCRGTEMRPGGGR